MGCDEKHVADNLTGGCQCGAVRYALRGAPIKTYVCHCRECQMQSASAFGISVLVRPQDIEVVKGKPKIWARPTEGGAPMPCYFCGECGSRLFHGDLKGDAPVSVKGGSFDTPVNLQGAMHIWTKRKLPCVVIPDDAVSFAGDPDC